MKLSTVMATILLVSLVGFSSSQDKKVKDGKVFVPKTDTKIPKSDPIDPKPGIKLDAKPLPKDDKPAKELPGKVSEKPGKKFKEPIATPPDKKPPDKKGGHWHWHRWHGYVWLPIGVSPPNVFILPENFQLPATVFYYEAEETPIIIQCPHCGQRIAIYVR